MFGGSRRRQPRSDSENTVAERVSERVEDVAAPFDQLLDRTAAELEQTSFTISASDTEVVLKRAIELADDQVALAGHLPVQSVQEVAAELHLPVASVADALAEHRAGVLREIVDGSSRRQRGIGVADRLVGPSSVTVRHRSGKTDSEVTESLVEWLSRHHGLRTRVTSDGAVVAIPARGPFSALARQVRAVSGRGGLDKVGEIRAAAVTGESGRTSICMTVDIRRQRTYSVVAGSAVAVGGATVASTVAVTVAPVILVGVPISVGTGWIVSRVGHRSRLKRVTEEMEIAADNVASGAKPPTIFSRVTDLLGRRSS